MATLQDIADEVGISKAAVSRILNHKGSFSAETITQVEEVARRLNYVTAAMLQEEQDLKLISVVVPPTTSPYFGTLVSFAEQAAAEFGYSLMLQTSLFDRGRIEQSLGDLKRRRFAGILLGTYADYFSLVTDSSLPIVTVGYKLSDEIPSVRTDSVAAGQIAARHLLSKSCRHLAYLTGNPRGVEDDERYQGFASVLAGEGIEPCTCAVGWSSRVRGTASELVTNLALEHPEIDGIFCESQSFTATCLRVYHDLGYKVPEEVKICGYGTRQLMAYCTPAPTIICENTEFIAHKAVETLIEIIENGKPEGEAAEVVVPVSLEVHQTT